MSSLRDINSDGKTNFGDTWLGDLLGFDGKFGVQYDDLGSSLKGSRRRPLEEIAGDYVESRKKVVDAERRTSSAPEESPRPRRKPDTNRTSSERPSDDLTLTAPDSLSSPEESEPLSVDVTNPKSSRDQSPRPPGTDGPASKIRQQLQDAATDHSAGMQEMSDVKDAILGTGHGPPTRPTRGLMERREPQLVNPAEAAAAQHPNRMNPAVAAARDENVNWGRGGRPQ